jgi:SAM-dependent methyltransferase
VASRTSYGPALAAVHHHGYGDVAEDAARALAALLRRAGVHRQLVIDLGCGSGILARGLTARGFDVLGVDPSSAMIRLARQTAPRARFVLGSAETVDLPACGAIVSTGEAITYLSPGKSASALLRRHVRRAARALPPGGLFVFDAIVRDPERPLRYRTWREAADWLVLVEADENVRRGELTRRIAVLTRSRGGWRRSDETHRVGVYDRRWVVATLQAHGFTVRTLRRYGRTPLGARRVVFVGRKRERAGRK